MPTRAVSKVPAGTAGSPSPANAGDTVPLQWIKRSDCRNSQPLRDRAQCPAGVAGVLLAGGAWIGLARRKPTAPNAEDS